MSVAVVLQDFSRILKLEAALDYLEEQKRITAELKKQILENEVQHH